MLSELEARLRTERDARSVRLKAAPHTTDPRELERHVAEIAALLELEDYRLTVLTTRNELEEERQDALAERFAGIWPPSDPLAIQAMAATLIIDGDELCDDYLGEEEDFGERTGPVAAAWGEMQDALQAMTPDTPDRATAVYFAWAGRAKNGIGCAWRDEHVAAARKLAMPSLPRAR